MSYADAGGVRIVYDDEGLGPMTRWFSWVGGVLVAGVFSLCLRSAWLPGTG